MRAARAAAAWPPTDWVRVLERHPEPLGLAGEVPTLRLVLARNADEGAVRGRAPAGIQRGPALTPAEIALLRSLCETDVVTLMLDDKTVAARARYEATLESLREMQKAGWVELEVNQATRCRRGRSGVKPAAAARCTETGREALRLLGEA
jgi:hypothetical protein